MTREQMLKRIKELGGLTRPNCLKVAIEKYREMTYNKNIFDSLVKCYQSENVGRCPHNLSHNSCAMCELYEYKPAKYDCEKCGLRCEEDNSIYRKVRMSIILGHWKGFKTTCEEMITKCQEMLRECENQIQAKCNDCGAIIKGTKIDGELFFDLCEDCIEEVRQKAYDEGRQVGTEETLANCNKSTHRGDY